MYYTKSNVNKDYVIITQDRHTNQWNRIESPEKSLYIYGQLILTRLPRRTNGERNSQQSVLRQLNSHIQLSKY